MVKLTFIGNDYNVSILTQSFPASPKVDIDAKEIDLDTHSVEIDDKNFKDDRIAFVHREGKYVPIMGRELCRQQLAAGNHAVAGVLLTKHTLKRAKIEILSAASVIAINELSESRPRRNDRHTKSSGNYSDRREYGYNSNTRKF